MQIIHMQKKIVKVFKQKILINTRICMFKVFLADVFNNF